MNIRPFNPTDAEYKAIVQIINQAWPDMPTTVEAVRYGYEHRNPQYLHQRVVVEDESTGKLLAMGDYFESSWAHVPGKYRIDFDILPGHEQALMQPLYDYMLGKLAQRTPALQKLVGFTREDKAQVISFFTSHGFEQVMREPRSAQNVADFDFERYDGLMEKLAQTGIRLYSLAELQGRDPDWLTKYYKLDWEIEQDIPMLDPPIQQPLGQFRKKLSHPNFRADGIFFAVDESAGQGLAASEYVGISSIWVRPPSTERVTVGVTGIKRSHRRRGIATALKVRAAAFARDIGARRIETDNEENNPMYELNMRLGFKPLPAWLEFVKELDSEEWERSDAALAVGD